MLHRAWSVMIQQEATEASERTETSNAARDEMPQSVVGSCEVIVNISALDSPEQLDFQEASGYCCTAGDDDGPPDTFEEPLGPVSQRVDAGCIVDGSQDIGRPT